MSHFEALIESVAASNSWRCILKSFCISLAIVILGIGVFWVSLDVVKAHLHHLGRISFDPREDAWFRVGFIAPTALTLLALLGFHGALSRLLMREHRYSTLVGACASGAFVGLSFLFFMAFGWIVY